MAGDDESVISVLKTLSKEVGEVTGEFKGLKDHITIQTTQCRTNYEALDKSFGEVLDKFEEMEIEDTVQGKVKLRLRRSADKKKKVLYNRLTLICVIVMALGAFLSIERWGLPWNAPEVYTRVEAEKDQTLLLDQIRKLEDALKDGGSTILGFGEIR